MSCMPTSLSFTTISAQPVRVSAPPPLPPLRRPGLLIRAARTGLAGWRRGRDLPRLLGTAVIPAPAQVVRLLLAEEAWQDEARRAKAADYSVERHVSLLIALLAEAGPAAPGAQILPFTGRGTARPARP